MLKISKIDSKSELMSKLNDYSEDSFILGENLINPKEYYLVNLNNFQWENQLNFGIISEVFGLNPVVTSLTNYIILVGYNNNVTILDYLNKRMNSYKSLFPFYEFMNIKELNKVLAIFEAYIFAFDYKGTLEWECDCNDIIINYQLDRSLLIIDFMDSSSKKLSLSHGKFI